MKLWNGWLSWPWEFSAQHSLLNSGMSYPFHKESISKTTGFLTYQRTHVLYIFCSSLLEHQCSTCQGMAFDWTLHLAPSQHPSNTQQHPLHWLSSRYLQENKKYGPLHPPGLFSCCCHPVSIWIKIYYNSTKLPLKSSYPEGWWTNLEELNILNLSDSTENVWVWENPLKGF